MRPYLPVIEKNKKVVGVLCSIFSGDDRIDSVVADECRVFFKTRGASEIDHISFF